MFNHICPGSRDFWMLEVGSEKHFLPEPTTHARGLQTLKFACYRALDFAQTKFVITEEEFLSMKRQIAKLTWHSARVPLLNAAVHR